MKTKIWLQCKNCDRDMLGYKRSFCSGICSEEFKKKWKHAVSREKFIERTENPENLNPLDNKTWLTEMARNHTMAFIAEAVGVSVPTVEKYYRRWGIHKQNILFKKTNLLPEEVENLIKSTIWCVNQALIRADKAVDK